MRKRIAKANVTPVRQRTQYTCMATSLSMCLGALDHDATEDEVNRAMGARPMQGASWEQMLAAAQHFGCRATLTMPSTVEQLKEWTDQGLPIVIAWNPEGRPWSHASVVFDVTEGEDGFIVHIADPNIPNPNKVVREVPEEDFYKKWFEQFPDYLVRRPACVISREVSEGGEQMKPTNIRLAARRVAREWQRRQANWEPGHVDRDVSFSEKPYDWGAGSSIPDGDGNRFKRAFEPKANLWVAIDGNEVLGASGEAMAADRSDTWWNQQAHRSKGRDFDVVLAQGVPMSIAQDLVDFGGSDRWPGEYGESFRSPREAYAAVRRYLLR